MSKVYQRQLAGAINTQTGTGRGVLFETGSTSHSLVHTPYSPYSALDNGRCHDTDSGFLLPVWGDWPWLNMSSDTTCAVVGCSNNSKKIKNLLETECFDHKIRRRECPCPVPYRLHSMPQSRRLDWLAVLKLKHPPKKVYVCSHHFVHKRPTEDHPNPELFLGYDRPVVKKRRTIVRVEATGKPLSMLNYVSDRITLQVNSSCLHFYELHQPVLQKYLGSLTYIFMNNMPIMSLDREDVLKTCPLLVYSWMPL